MRYTGVWNFLESGARATRSLENEDTVLLQCVTNYSSHFENVNIRVIKSMGEIFDVLVLTGYSEHLFAK
jgi:sialic acid synthase SpsE